MNPNVGPAFAGDLKLLGMNTPDQLRGQDPFRLYQRLSRKTGVRQDPGVLDSFMSLTDFMKGAERKQRYGQGQVR